MEWNQTQSFSMGHASSRKLEQSDSSIMFFENYVPLVLPSFSITHSFALEKFRR